MLKDFLRYDFGAAVVLKHFKKGRNWEMECVLVLSAFFSYVFVIE